MDPSNVRMNVNPVITAYAPEKFPSANLRRRVNPAREMAGA
jgi:hypothetical protein